MVSRAAARISNFRSSVADADVPHVPAVVEAQKNVSNGSVVASTVPKDVLPAAESCAETAASGEKSAEVSVKPVAPRPPKAPKGSFDRQAANRGRRLFRNEAGCATCHQGPHFTDVLSGPSRTVPFLHDPAEVGTDPAYALRTATGKYRTTPLRGLWQHPPYFHDGSAPDLLAVVNHYDQLFGLNLTAAQKADLVEFLKSL